MSNPRGNQGIPEWIKEIKKNKIELEKSAVKVEKIRTVYETNDRSGPSFLSFPYVVKANVQSDDKLGEVSGKRKCENKIDSKFSREKSFDENVNCQMIPIKGNKERLSFGKRREELLNSRVVILSENQNILNETASPCLKLNIESISSIIKKNKGNKEQILSILNEVSNEVKRSWTGYEILPKITDLLDEILTKYIKESKESRQTRQENLEKYEKEAKKIFEYRKKILTALENLIPVHQDSVFDLNINNTKKNVKSARNKLEEVKQDLSKFLLDFRKPVETEPNCEELEIETFKSLIMQKKRKILTDYIGKVKWSLSMQKDVDRKNFKEFEKVAEELM